MRDDRADPEARFGGQIDAFWAFWDGVPRIDLQFAALFDPMQMQTLIGMIAQKTGVVPVANFVPPPGRDATRRIQIDKAATRLLGRHAPRINTTIHTLKG